MTLASQNDTRSEQKSRNEVQSKQGQDSSKKQRNLLTSSRDQQMKQQNLSEEALPVQRALGVQICSEDDTFKFSIKNLVGVKINTRRLFLSFISSIFDPIGFLAPVLLKAKLILQKLCASGMGWDDPIPLKEDWLIKNIGDSLDSSLYWVPRRQP